jgi:energy-coupling factor transport system permease protein
MTYRPTASPLHAARAAAALAWCAALVISALIESNPVMLGAIGLSVVIAGLGAGVGTGLRRALRIALPLAATIIFVNALVTRNGLTVIWRFGDLPILGQTNVTLEAVAYGAVLGLRAAILLLIGALYSLAVDPDNVLRLLRRVSFRSALTATIATRMVPVLLRDSRRLADAQRCRPGPPPGRYQLLRATTSGMLDRALDVAAALEVRGYGDARRPPSHRAPWSRHDVAFIASAVAVLAVSIGSRVGGVVPFNAYPSLYSPAGAGPLLAAAGVIVVALLPFADRRGIER